MEVGVLFTEGLEYKLQIIVLVQENSRKKKNGEG